MSNNRIIRKISVGNDYPYKSMHFEKGQVIENKRSNTKLFEIVDIVQSEPSVFEIYIKNNDDETMLWDRFVNMPVVVQYEVYL